MLSQLRKGNWSEAALKVLRERYLYTGTDGVQETPEQMIWRVAYEVARAESHDDDIILETAQRFYDMMIDHKFLPNSPTLMNAGLHNGLTILCLLCFAS